jgi:pimeloyl-ACP methyl ester carboxylesterase
MEKSSSLPGNSSSSGLTSFFSRNTTRLLGKIVPGWTNNQIDSMMFVPKSAQSKPVRLPRGFEQFIIKTRDGNLQAYQTGKGPTVVFVHGWGGASAQFFPLMRGLARCGFSSLVFDHLGHGLSDSKSATLQQSIASTNHVLSQVSKSSEGLCAVVGHATGCIAIANARAALLRDIPLFLISPVFNYKLFFLKRLVKLGLHADLVKKYANRFSKTYSSEYRSLELANKLAQYGDVSVIAHDESDSESDAADSVEFCNRYPLTKLLLTRDSDHVRIINSESVWQELKSHLNYDDTTINFTAEVLHE